MVHLIRVLPVVSDGPKEMKTWDTNSGPSKRIPGGLPYVMFCSKVLGVVGPRSVLTRPVTFVSPRVDLKDIRSGLLSAD